MRLFEIHGALSTDSINRLERILRLKLGKLYRFGGETGVLTDDKGHLGYLYFYGKRAFRLDVLQSDRRIAFIDIWDDGAAAVAGHTADYQVELPSNVSIFRILTQVIKILKHPKMGDIEAVEDANVKEATEEERIDLLFLNEAARTTVEQFVTYAKEWAVKNDKHDLQFEYGDLKAVASEYDVMIPGGIYEIGIGDRSSKIYDLSRVEQSSTGVIIRVHPPGHGHQFKFEPSVALSRTDQKALEQAIEPVSAEELFDDLERLVKMVVKGARPSLVVIGGPGTGKTKTITDTVNAAGLKKGPQWIMVKGKASPMALYSTIFMNKGKLILFDDTDSVWGNEDSVNILKAALDSSPIRTVSWASPATQAVTHMSDDEKAEYEQKVFDQLQEDPAAKVKLPGEFDFDGRIIFISNMPKKELDPAVLNRSMFIDMTLTPDQVFDRIEGIMDKLSSPNSMEVTHDTKLEVFEFLKEQSASGKMKYVSIRTFIGALGVASSGDPEWKRLLKYMGGE